MNDMKIWTLDGSKATPLDAFVQMESEWNLEDTLVNNPDLLMDRLTLVGRQITTEGGDLDLLGVDKYGRLVVFELKRGILRREAVAQVIDYASDLEGRDWTNLCSLISENSGSDGIEKIEDFDEWYGLNHKEPNPKPIRMVIVGLGADAQTERMVKFLADDNGMDISLLTFHGFNLEGMTFLAKQVETRAESGVRRTASNSNHQERWDALCRKADDFGNRELFDSAVAMFRKTWDGKWLGEYANQNSLRIDLDVRVAVGKRPYARVEVKEEIWITFHQRAFTLCEDAFKRALESAGLEYQPSPPSQEEWRNANLIRLPLTAADWERHKETLTALAKAVYAAWENGGADESDSGGE